MIRWLKPAVFLACLGPAAWLIYGAFLGGDLAKLIEAGAHRGEWRLRILRLGDIIEPDHRHILRHPVASGPQRLHRRERR